MPSEPTDSDNRIIFARVGMGVITAKLLQGGVVNSLFPGIGSGMGAAIVFGISDKGISNELLPQISGNALKLFCALTNCLDYSNNAIVEMSATELQTITGLSEQTVRRSLNELEELGFIKRMGSNAQRKYILNERYIRRYE